MNHRDDYGYREEYGTLTYTYAEVEELRRKGIAVPAYARIIDQLDGMVNNSNDISNTNETLRRDSLPPISRGSMNTAEKSRSY